MFAPAGRITARASRLCRLAELVVRRQALAPWTPNYVGRGRAGLKNRQDTFFDAPPTRSRLTAPPKKSPPGRGGVCPARGQMVTQKYRVIRRGGIYAARCSRPGNAIYRANRTGRIYASPTNLPEISHHHGIWRQQNSPPRRGGVCPARDRIL